MSDDSFLLDLRQDCLKQVFHESDELQEALSHFDSDRNQALQTFVRLIGSMRNNFQSVGFTYFAEAMQSIGTDLKKLETRSLGDAKSQLTEVIRFVKRYTGQLMEGREDSAGLVSSVREEGGALEVVTMRQFLMCQKGSLQIAIPIENVAEIIQGAKVFDLPHPSKNVLGLLFLRGDTVSVLDLKALKGEQHVDLKHKFSRYFVVAQVGNSRFSFSVDKVHDVKDVAISDESVQADRPIALVDDKVVMFVNLEKELAA